MIKRRDLHQLIISDSVINRQSNPPQLKSTTPWLKKDVKLWRNLRLKKKTHSRKKFKDTLSKIDSSKELNVVPH